MKAKISLVITGLFYLIFTATLSAQTGIEEKQVFFDKGKTSATISEKISGDQTIDYVLGAKKGQTMTVNLKTDNTANYFNVLPPGSEEAIFIGSTLGNYWTGVLPEDGNYKIRVYLMRNAARRNEKANYTLKVGITGHSSASHDAKVAGTDYHATGIIDCSSGTEAKYSSQCNFGVIRKGMAKAEVHVTTTEGEKRIIEFNGEAVSSPDPKVKVKASREGYDWNVSVNDLEYYFIPDGVINGG